MSIPFFFKPFWERLSQSTSIFGKAGKTPTVSWGQNYGSLRQERAFHGNVTYLEFFLLENDRGLPNLNTAWKSNFDPNSVLRADLFWTLVTLIVCLPSVEVFDWCLACVHAGARGVPNHMPFSVVHRGINRPVIRHVRNGRPTKIRESNGPHPTRYPV